MVDRPRKPSAISPSHPPSSDQPVVDVASDRVTAKLASGDSVDVLLHGATVISWKSKGNENLFLSKGAVLDGSKAVRGGIPVVFPVFGPPPANHATSKLPQHGFARNSRWEYLGRSTSESGSLSKGGDDSVKLDFGLSSSSISQEARAQWPEAFGLIYSVTLAKDGLQTVLTVQNEGQQPLEFQMLLHTYFKVQDISKTQVTGLLGAPYVDKVLNSTSSTEGHASLPITGEVDRVYSDLKQDTTSITEDGKPRFDIVRDNLSDTVVWNPWKEKAAGMSDFEPKDAYKQMICIEAGSVSEWQKLEPGEAFEGGQILKAYL